MAVRYSPTVELALSANLLADPSTWVWTDVSRYVRNVDGITIARGRGDGFSTAPAARCNLTFINDGRFVPRNPSGAYYGTIARNTPLRVKLSGSTRFVGYVDEWPTTWADASARTSFAPITASGLLRRLNQSGVLQSAMYRSLTGSSPIAYWPMEDGGGSQQCVSAITGGPPLTGLGNIRFGSVGGPAGSKSLPDFTLGGSMRGPVPASSALLFRAEVSILVNPLTTGNLAVPFDIYTGGGVQTWELVVPAAVDILNAYLRYTFSDGSTGVVSTGMTLDDGVWHHIRLDVAKLGSDTTYTVYVDGNATTATGSHVGVAFGGVTSVVVAPRALPTTNPASAGHVTVWASTPASDTFAIFTGWTGESAYERWARLGVENSLPLSSTFTSTATLMGPQQSSSVLALLREIEATDQGVIYDGLTGRLTLRPHEDRNNQALAMTLNVSLGQVGWPFQGTDDDQQLRNDVTASGATGSSARYVITSGANTPAAVGTYAESLSANVAADAQLAPIAQWRAHLGAVEDLRYPNLTLNLTASPELVTSWLTCDIGSRIAVTNISRLSVLPVDDLDLLIEGYTERIDSQTWLVSLNTSPARPWDVFVLDGSANTGRLESGGSTLTSAYSSSATSMLAATSAGPTWSTAGVPYDWEIAGERLTVTAVADITPSVVATGTAAHADNASVTPGLPAGAQQGDLLIVYAAIRSTSGVVGTPSGYSVLFAAGHVAAFCKIHTGTESAPTVSFTSGAAGDTTSAQVAALRGVTPTVLFGPSTQSNASAQNIAYPAMTYSGGPLVVLWFGWKQDDWTSVANFETEIGEPSTTTGNDQGLVWNFSYQSLTTGLSSGSWTVTGGASAISESYVVAVDCRVQSATVTRAVNGVSKAQASGAAVRLWRAGVVAL